MKPEQFAVENRSMVIELIMRWMELAGVTSTYQLYLLANVPRTSLHRYMTRQTPIPVAVAKRLVEALSEEAGSAEFRQAFNALLPPLSTAAKLQAAFRRHGVPVAAAMDAVRSTGLI